MTQTYLHRPNLKIEAMFSPESTPLYRYHLTVTKSNALKDPKTVCAIMQNPSEAGVEIADRSIQVLERVIFEHKLPEFSGVERLVVVNQFAFIQTTEFSGNQDKIGDLNDKVVYEAIRTSDIILIARERDNRYLERQRRILNFISKYNNKPIYITSRHPSRVIYDGFIRRYDAQKASV